MPASTKSSQTSTEPKLALRTVLLSGWTWVVACALVVATYVFGVTRAELGAGGVMLVLGAGALGWAGSALFSTLLPREGELSSGKARVTGRRRKELEREKHLVLRAIKELEFDRDMGKVGAADFDEISSRFRARARRLLRELDDEPDDLRGIIEKELRARLRIKGIGPDEAGSSPPAPALTEAPAQVEQGALAPRAELAQAAPAPGECPACRGANDVDARFCKHCGAKIAGVAS